MRTSYFTHPRLPEGCIAISRGVPPYWRALNKPRLAELAPTWEMLKRGYTHDEYRRMLARLDAREIWEKAHRLVWPHEPVLLCWEEDPIMRGPFCHRRLVAEWIEDELGIYVPELRLRGRREAAMRAYMDWRAGKWGKPKIEMEDKDK